LRPQASSQLFHAFAGPRRFEPLGTLDRSRSRRQNLLLAVLRLRHGVWGALAGTYSIRLAGRSLPRLLLSALYQRCNNQDILSWWLASFEPGVYCRPAASVAERGETVRASALPATAKIVSFEVKFKVQKLFAQAKSLLVPAKSYSAATAT
jgi:hypothetical protein